MSASISPGYVFGSTETVTSAKLATLVSGATIANITGSEIASDAAIANSKLNLASISQAIAMTGGLTLSSVGLVMSAQEILEAKGADVASATTTTIWVSDGNFIHITGTTTITGFGTAAQAGQVSTCVFDGILTLTHNSTSLILPTGANITTAAGDTITVRAETTANARVIAYIRKDGTALVGANASTAMAGSIIQVVNTQTGAVATGTTVMPYDDTIPQITEGDQYMTLAITPNNTNNKLKIDVVFFASVSAGGTNQAALFQDATAGALAAGTIEPNVNLPGCIHFTHYMAAGTTSATTFRVRGGVSSAGTMTFNGKAAGRLMGGVMASSITISEIKV